MSPPEMLAELDRLAALFEGAVLAVGFKGGTALVLAGDPDKPQQLGALIDGGGTPLAFLFQRREGRQLEVVATPLKPVENAPGIEDYLQSLTEWYRGALVQDGLAVPPTVN